MLGLKPMELALIVFVILLLFGAMSATLARFGAAEPMVMDNWPMEPLQIE